MHQFCLIILYIKPVDYIKTWQTVKLISEQFDSFSFLIEHLNTDTNRLRYPLCRPSAANAIDSSSSSQQQPSSSVSLSGLINLLPPSFPPLFLLSHLPLTLLHPFLPFLCSIPFYSLLHVSPPPSSTALLLSSSPFSSSSSFCLPPTVIYVCVIDEQSGGCKELVNLLSRKKKTHLSPHLHNAKTGLNATDAKRELLMLHMLRESLKRCICREKVSKCPLKLKMLFLLFMDVHFLPHIIQIRDAPV